MKRLCIYVTYDFENIVDDYIGYMLHELRKVVDYLVVVCNYEYILSGIDNVKPYADKIYYRENKGFDAGAYKDTLCYYLGWDEIGQYDELLFINDSFYGPLYSIEELFNKMEKVNTDYWGLIRAPQGNFDDGCPYDAHIQSYFWAFRTKILKKAEFRNFWEKLEYPKSLSQAVREYEIGCNRFLKIQGFTGTALTDLVPTKQLFREEENPYMQHSLELIRNLKIPIIKRKSLYFSNKGFPNALKALQYIEDQNIYDFTLITKHLIRISQLAQSQGMMNLLTLNSFHEKYEKLYFYGAGVYGHNLAALFEYMGWNFNGFVVTHTENQMEDCMNFNEIKLEDCDAIIITVADEKVCMQILETVKKRCNIEQILYPNFGT